MKLPTGLPQIFTGLKIASVGVMAGAITGEFLGGGKGFGELIRTAASQLNTPRVFSLILYLSPRGSGAVRHLVTWAAPHRVLAQGPRAAGMTEAGDRRRSRPRRCAGLPRARLPSPWACPRAMPAPWPG
jgi:NitT/TauT family transport system permease protein